MACIDLSRLGWACLEAKNDASVDVFDPDPKVTAMWDLLIHNAHIATLSPSHRAPYGMIRDGAIGVKDGKITFVGARLDLPGPLETLATTLHDADGGWITPGLIDAHTHLVFGGDRALEWEMRLNGATYEDIARAGGGILSTVRATREASLQDLVTTGQKRLRHLARQGVTTVEIKSGYGLDLENELKILKAAQELARPDQIRICPTLLGAHALPPEYKDRREAYVDLVCEQMIPQAAEQKLATCVDAFLENIAFTYEETDRIFTTAKAHGLKVRLHAEQLSDQGGALLAARHGALSADHLEYLTPEGIEALKDADVVAMLLPGAYYFLRETKMPPVAELRQAKVAMAIASDLNPGTSPILSPLLTLNMACTLFRLTPEEALAGMTRHAAKALGLADVTGHLKVGLMADLAIWNIDHPAELSYWLGGDLLKARYVAGEKSDFGRSL